MTQYEVVLGLEVHVELATESKIFCSCSAKFGADANENVCPACCGMPGMLPVTNEKVVELGITAGIVTNCHINQTNTFDKKNYFYPDLPASYQITQLYAPICVDGCVTIDLPNGEKKDIRIKQIHMEEDAGKLVHDQWEENSLIDYNRTSVPLTEIVSEPDFRSAEEVVAYLTKLRSILRFAKVSDCRMEQGSMRADINLSVRPVGETKLGTRTEMKNMNSISAIVRAIAYETQRHIDALEEHTEVLVQETRRWDDVKNKSFPMRNKENAADYRYFPNPDLVPIVITDAWIEDIRNGLPEMPDVVKARLLTLGLSEKDCDVIVSSKTLVDLFDGTYAICQNAKESSNWISTECMTIANRNQVALDDFVLDGTKLGELIQLVINGDINRNSAKTVLAAIYSDNVSPAAYCKEHGLVNLTDESALTGIIDAVIARNAQSVADYKNGKEKALDAIFGQVMRETKGSGNPGVIRKILLEKLS